MEDVYINSTVQDKMDGYTSVSPNAYNTYNTDTYNTYNTDTYNSEYQRYIENLYFIDRVLTSITACIGLSLTLVAIYALYSLVRSDHVAPIYIINLLISDLIQLCCMIPWMVKCNDIRIWYSYCFSLMASVGFMVCIALERYLVISFPLWYRCRRTIKTSVLLCVAVWVFSLVVILLPETEPPIRTFLLLLTFPFLIFFLGGTLKALSASRVPSDEKRRIVGTLVLVLLIYTLLLLPRIIFYLTGSDNYTANTVTIICLQLNPLADLALYVFMRRGAIDNILTCVCCSRINSNYISTLTTTV